MNTDKHIFSTRQKAAQLIVFIIGIEVLNKKMRCNRNFRYLPFMVVTYVIVSAIFTTAVVIIKLIEIIIK
jgi:predicted nucleic acid-binding Zn ribbon protein